MKLIHLILAHHPNSLEQLARLVNKLYHTDSLVYMHIDLKTDINLFKDYFRDYPQIRFVSKRISIKWAGYSMVEAEEESFKQILLEEPDFDYLNLLSAHDYPIRPIDEFHEFLEINLGKAFMHCLDINTEWVEAKKRVEEYHLINYDFYGKYFIENLINTILPKRTMPSNMVMKGRSQWFTISKKHVQYIIDQLGNNKKMVCFFKFTWAPDEFIFQSILFNSPYRNEIVNNNLRYIDWSESKSNPKTLTYKDLDRILKSGSFFARKFNHSDDSIILDRIDDQILT